jgi:hypothetical protein
VASRRGGRGQTRCPSTRRAARTAVKPRGHSSHRLALRPAGRQGARAGLRPYRQAPRALCPPAIRPAPLLTSCDRSRGRSGQGIATIGDGLAVRRGSGSCGRGRTRQHSIARRPGGRPGLPVRLHRRSRRVRGRDRSGSRPVGAKGAARMRPRACWAAGRASNACLRSRGRPRCRCRRSHLPARHAEDR